MARPVNEACIALVKKFEGLRLHAYRCAAGKWTVGYGHTHGVSADTWVSADEAEALLLEDLHDAGVYVSHLVKVPLTDNQHGALASFVFNVGPAKFKGSTLLKRLNDGVYDAVPAQLQRWTKARHPNTGEMVDLPGLVRRRRAEAALWSTTDD